MSEHFYDLLPNDEAFMLSEFFNVFCGDRIGKGYDRETFVLRTDPTKVVKIEVSKGGMQNLREMAAWFEVQGTPYEKWFAPIDRCSANGRILIQHRTMPGDKSKYPKKLPNFLTDHKYSNYGFLNGKFVCHDYGTNALMLHGLNNRLKAVEWWD